MVQYNYSAGSPRLLFIAVHKLHGCGNILPQYPRVGSVSARCSKSMTAISTRVTHALLRGVQKKAFRRPTGRRRAVVQRWLVDSGDFWPALRAVLFCAQSGGGTEIGRVGSDDGLWRGADVSVDPGNSLFPSSLVVLAWDGPHLVIVPLPESLSGHAAVPRHSSGNDVIIVVFCLPPTRIGPETAWEVRFCGFRALVAEMWVVARVKLFAATIGAAFSCMSRDGTVNADRNALRAAQFALLQVRLARRVHDVELELRGQMFIAYFHIFCGRLGRADEIMRRGRLVAIRNGWDDLVAMAIAARHRIVLERGSK
jgi:Domain of unknown function (DUF4807)